MPVLVALGTPCTVFTTAATTLVLEQPLIVLNTVTEYVPELDPVAAAEFAPAVIAAPDGAVQVYVWPPTLGVLKLINMLTHVTLPVVLGELVRVVFCETATVAVAWQPLDTFVIVET